MKPKVVSIGQNVVTTGLLPAMELLARMGKTPERQTDDTRQAHGVTAPAEREQLGDYRLVREIGPTQENSKTRLNTA